MGHTRPGLLSLPLELIHLLADDSCLSCADKGSLRLTCRSLAAAVAPYLFRTVVLSRLAKDKDNLINIARSPSLAQHVRTLVWHELDVDRWTPSTRPLSSTWGEEHTFWESLLSRMHDPMVFWWPRHCVLDSVTFYALMDAVQSLPQLRALESIPMPRERLILGAAYPLSSYTFRILHEHDMNESRTRNDGFMRFLLPILRKPSIASRIRKLLYVDEAYLGLHCYLSDGGSIVHDSGVDSFSHLEEIDVYINSSHNHVAGSGGTVYEYEAELPDFVASLQEATNLRQLTFQTTNLRQASFVDASVDFAHFNFEWLPVLLATEEDAYGPSWPSEKIADQLMLHRCLRLEWETLFECHWECLSSLNLGHVYASPSAVLGLVRRHAKTLRRLVLSEYAVSTETLIALREMRLRLNLLQIPCDDAFSWLEGLGEVHIVPEDDLLAFINQDSASCVTNEGFTITADHEHWKHVDNPLIVTSNASTSWPWLEDPEPGSQDQFLLPVPPDEHEDSDVESTSPHMQCPRWDWDHVGQDVYYWRVDANDDEADNADNDTVERGRVPTTLWRYTSPEGREVFGGPGAEPLEVFSDWESDSEGETGYRVEPTPYCYELRQYAQKVMGDKSKKEDDEPSGSGQSEPPPAKQLPANARLYTSCDDPLVNWDLESVVASTGGNTVELSYGFLVDSPKGFIWMDE
ncbi:hypothetical protein F4780DRAFT_735877 [Xylariomycetidae sp. FL0641]|nr:hypothetical protein F4780DRAFT_735877 [Xylariomycetidae sp. FL0641]